MTVLSVHVTVKQVRSKNTRIRYQNAKKRLKKIIQDQEEELILCTHDTIQHLKPEKYITENDKKNFYPQ